MGLGIIFPHQIPFSHHHGHDGDDVHENDYGRDHGRGHDCVHGHGNVHGRDDGDGDAQFHHLQ